MKTILKMATIVMMTVVLVNCSKDEDVLKKNSGILKSTNPSGGHVVYNRQVYPLTAGRNINAGNVSIASDSFNLYVTVRSIQGFQSDSQNIKLWLGTDLAFLDGGGARRPALGKLPYKLTTQVDSGSFIIARASVPQYDITRIDNQTIYFVLGADVIVGKGRCRSKETAFAGTIKGKGRAWWYYGVYVDSCCKAPTPIIY